MTPRSDPYRILGLVPGATPGEIRSAYRRLAKMHHPDTAGERSLPRFLGIKAAYEELVDGEGRLRARGWPTRGAGASTTRPGNPGAKGASRDAWRARQGSAASGAKANAGPSAEAESKRRAKADGGATTGDASAGEASAGEGNGGAGPSADAGPKRRPKPDSSKSSGGSSRGSPRGKTAERRTAKPGSTTYDEATLGLDPSWDGAGWYGASSGSYWTLNPREYADPRKHGPEYQQRARRAAKLEALLRARRAAEAAAAAGSSVSGSGASSEASPGPTTEMPPASSATAEPDADPRERGS